MNRPQILFIVPLPPPWAGVEQISQILIDSSLRDNFDLKILKSNIRDSNAAKGVWDLIGVSRVLGICLKLFLLLFFRRPDAVYLTLSQNTAGLSRDCVYILICRFFRVPVIAHLHGSKLGDFLKSRHLIQKVFFTHVINMLAAIIVCAKSIKADLSEFVPSSRIHVIYNESPLGPTSLLLNNQRQMINVAFMGHLSVAKGFYDLIGATQIILRQNPQVFFHFAGERLDDERNIHLDSDDQNAKKNWVAVEAIMKNYPLNFKFHGIITGEEKRKFFENSDLFVLPSYAEAFPVAVLEAISFGLPLIVTPVGALSEVLKENVNALFVNPGQCDDLARKIIEVSNDRGMRMSMASNNLELAAKFSPGQMAKQLRPIIFEILKD